MTLRPNKPTITEVDIAEVVAQLERGNLSKGSIIKTVEDDVAAIHYRSHGVAFSSATSAFDALFEYILEPGDEVIISPFTFKSVPQAILRAGGKPVFIDIGDNFVPSWERDIPALITDKTKAVVVTHLFGFPDSGVFYLCGEYDFFVIEDCAQSIGSKFFGGDYVGGNSDAAVFSFYATKNVTGAEGGVVICDDQTLDSALYRLRDNERVGNRIGTNRRMSDLHAALIHSQLIRLKEITAHRNLVAGIYGQQLILPNTQVIYEDTLHCYHQYTVVVEDHVNRDLLISRLRPYKIELGVYYDYLINYDSNYYDLLGVQYTPNAYRLSQKCVSLPIGMDVGIQEAMFVANKFNEVYDELSRP